MIAEFATHLAPPIQETFQSLNSPAQIQAYLDSIPYVGEDRNRSPLGVLQDKQSHCLDGGLLAALALSQLGYPAQIIDLVPAPNTDDDHVLAIFQQNGLWGAVAKSNYVGLRFREPVYRSLRELVMSYFEGFFNLYGQKTLRGYTRPLRLARFDATHWAWDEAGVEKIVAKLYSLPMIPVVSDAAIAGLSPVDERSLHAGMLGTNLDGVYKPKP